MNTQVTVRLLRKLRFCESLPKEVLDQLAVSATLCRFPAGGVLFREGTQSDRLLIVAKGHVVLAMRVPGRDDVRILSLGPGDMVAWSALLTGGRMTASAVALEDTEVVSVSARDVLAICESNHSFGYHVMRQMGQALADRLLATRLQLLDLFAETSPEVPLESRST